MKRVYKRRMDELREETGVQMSLTKKIGDIPAEMGCALGADEGRENGKESVLVEGAR